MRRAETASPPADAADRRSAKPHIAYPVDRMPPFDSAFYELARSGLTKITALTVPPREGRAFAVPAGHFFRIVSIDGPQVGDLNLWNAHDLSERFFSGKTRALHATHVTTGDRLWSTLPNLRPMATITHDTLRWYGWDEDGAGVHDVIGTRCDPYTNLLLNGVDYHHCCHSNLTHALAAERAMPFTEAERHVHDVLNYDDPFLSASGHIDIVDSVAGSSRHLQVDTLFDQLFVYLRDASDNDGIVVFDNRQKLRMRNPVPGVHGKAAIAQVIDAFIGDSFGYNNSHNWMAPLGFISLLEASNPPQRHNLPDLRQRAFRLTLKAQYISRARMKEQAGNLRMAPGGGRRGHDNSVDTHGVERIR